jgi:hypothetical protein
MSSPSTSATHHDGGGAIDTRELSTEIQRRDLYNTLSEYYNGICAVRKTHSSLKAKARSMCEGDCSYENISQPQTILRRRRTSPMSEAFKHHIQLSERVIRTVMQSTSSYNGTAGSCGVLHENGIVRTSSAGDHEMNVVALASLRASVSRLKAEFGGT